MEYQVEEVSPVKRKVNVQVPAEEVNAALSATIALYRKDLKMAGFRKGKVPASLVEQKYKKNIYEQAGKDLLTVHFNQIMGELDLEPVSGLDLDANELQKDQDFNYSFSFEIRPEIDLPEYRGLKASKKKIEVSEDLVDRMIQRLQREQSELRPVEEDRYPQEGDVTVIDFAAYQDGQPLEGIQAEKFELPLGQGQALEGFEEIVKGLKPGETGEGEVDFPEDFINTELAGQSATMKVTLNMLKERILPEVNDELAQKAGSYNSVQELREALAENFRQYMEQTEKSVVQKKLLDQLLSQVEVDLPETLVKSQLESMVERRRQQMEQQGKSLESEGGEDALREQLQSEAQELVKAHLVLLAIAKKEELSVSNQEVEQHIYSMAVNSGQDPSRLRDYYEKNNLMYAVRDSLLADKAMDLIYENATIEEIEPDEAKGENLSEQETSEQQREQDQMDNTQEE